MAKCSSRQVLFLIFNFLFLCLGLGLVGFVTWTLATIPNANEFISGTHVVTLTSFCLGIVILVIGGIGCAAGFCKGLCILKTYVGFMLTLLFLELGLIFFIYAEKSQLPSVIVESWDGLNTDTQYKIQSELECCGIENYTEYGTDVESYPSSCFVVYDVTGIIEKTVDNLFTADCLTQMQNWLNDHVPIWVSVLVAIAVIECLSGITSCIFLQRIHKKLKVEPDDDEDGTNVDTEMAVMETGASNDGNSEDTSNQGNEERDNSNGLIIVTPAPDQHIKDNTTIDYLSENDLETLSTKSNVDEKEQTTDVGNSHSSINGPSLIVVSSASKQEAAVKETKESVTDTDVEVTNHTQMAPEDQKDTRKEENGEDSVSIESTSTRPVVIVASVTNGETCAIKKSDSIVEDKSESSEQDEEEKSEYLNEGDEKIDNTSTQDQVMIAAIAGSKTDSSKETKGNDLIENDQADVVTQPSPSDGGKYESLTDPTLEMNTSASVAELSTENETTELPLSDDIVTPDGNAQNTSLEENNDRNTVDTDSIRSSPDPSLLLLASVKKLDANEKETKDTVADIEMDAEVLTQMTPKDDEQGSGSIQCESDPSLMSVIPKDEMITEQKSDAEEAVNEDISSNHRELDASLIVMASMCQREISTVQELKDSTEKSDAVSTHMNTDNITDNGEEDISNEISHDSVGDSHSSINCPPLVVVSSASENEAAVKETNGSVTGTDVEITNHTQMAPEDKKDTRKEENDEDSVSIESTSDQPVVIVASVTNGETCAIKKSDSIVDDKSESSEQDKVEESEYLNERDEKIDNTSTQDQVMIAAIAGSKTDSSKETEGNGLVENDQVNVVTQPSPSDGGKHESLTDPTLEMNTSASVAEMSTENETTELPLSDDIVTLDGNAQNTSLEENNDRNTHDTDSIRSSPDPSLLLLASVKKLDGTEKETKDTVADIEMDAELLTQMTPKDDEQGNVSIQCESDPSLMSVIPKDEMITEQKSDAEEAVNEDISSNHRELDASLIVMASMCQRETSTVQELKDSTEKSDAVSPHINTDNFTDNSADDISNEISHDSVGNSHSSINGPSLVVVSSASENEAIVKETNDSVIYTEVEVSNHTQMTQEDIKDTRKEENVDDSVSIESTSDQPVVIVASVTNGETCAIKKSDSIVDDKSESSEQDKVEESEYLNERDEKIDNTSTQDQVMIAAIAGSKTDSSKETEGNDLVENDQVGDVTQPSPNDEGKYESLTDPTLEMNTSVSVAEMSTENETTELPLSDDIVTLDGKTQRTSLEENNDRNTNDTDSIRSSPDPSLLLLASVKKLDANEKETKDTVADIEMDAELLTQMTPKDDEQGNVSIQCESDPSLMSVIPKDEMITEQKSDAEEAVNEDISSNHRELDASLIVMASMCQRETSTVQELKDSTEKSDAVSPHMNTDNITDNSADDISNEISHDSVGNSHSSINGPPLIVASSASENETAVKETNDSVTGTDVEVTNHTLMTPEDQKDTRKEENDEDSVSIESTSDRPVVILTSVTNGETCAIKKSDSIVDDKSEADAEETMSAEQSEINDMIKDDKNETGEAISSIQKELDSSLIMMSSVCQKETSATKEFNDSTENIDAGSTHMNTDDITDKGEDGDDTSRDLIYDGKSDEGDISGSSLLEEKTLSKKEESKKIGLMDNNEEEMKLVGDHNDIKNEIVEDKITPAMSQVVYVSVHDDETTPREEFGKPEDHLKLNGLTGDSSNNEDIEDINTYTENETNETFSPSHIVPVEIKDESKDETNDGNIFHQDLSDSTSELIASASVELTPENDRFAGCLSLQGEKEISSTSAASGNEQNTKNMENKDMDKDVLDHVDSSDVSQDNKEGRTTDEDHTHDSMNPILELVALAPRDEASGIDVTSGKPEIDQMASTDLKSDINISVTSDEKLELASPLIIPEASFIKRNDLAEKEQINSFTIEQQVNNNKNDTADENISNSFKADQNVPKTNIEHIGPDETVDIAESAGLGKIAEMLSNDIVIKQDLPDSVSVTLTDESGGKVENIDNTENKDIDKEVLEPVDSSDVSEDYRERTEDKDHNIEGMNSTAELVVSASTDEASRATVAPTSSREDITGNIGIDQVTSADLTSDINIASTRDENLELLSQMIIPKASLIDSNEVSKTEQISSSTTEKVDNDKTEETADDNNISYFTVDTALDQSVLKTNSENIEPEKSGNITENAGLDKTSLETIQNGVTTYGSKSKIENDIILYTSLHGASLDLDTVRSNDLISDENPDFVETEGFERTTLQPLSLTDVPQHRRDEAAEDKAHNKDTYNITLEQVISVSEDTAGSLTVLPGDYKKGVVESVNVTNDNNNGTTFESAVIDVSAGEQFKVISESIESIKNDQITKENEEIISNDIVPKEDLLDSFVESASVTSTNEPYGKVEDIGKTENEDKEVLDPIDSSDVSEDDKVGRTDVEDSSHERMNPTLELAASASTGKDITDTIEIDLIGSGDLKSNMNVAISSDEKLELAPSLTIPEAYLIVRNELSEKEQISSLTTEKGNNDDKDDKTDENISNNFTVDIALDQSVLMTNRESTGPEETGNITENVGLDKTSLETIQDAEQVDSASEHAAKSLTNLPNHSEKDIDKSVDVKSDNNEDTIHESDIVEVSPGEECKIISDSLENADITKENEEMLSHDLVFEQSLSDFSVESASVILTNETSGEVENIDNTENEDTDKAVPNDFHISDVSQDNTVDTTENKENNHGRMNPALEITALATTNEGPILNVAANIPGEDNTGTVEIDEMASSDMKPYMNTAITSDGKLELAPSLTIPEAYLIDRNELSEKKQISSSTTEKGNNDDKDEKTDENSLNNFTVDIALDQSVQMTNSESTGPEETGNITANVGLDKTSLETIQDADMTNGTEKEIMKDNILRTSQHCASLDLGTVISNGFNSTTLQTLPLTDVTQHKNDEAVEDNAHSKDTHDTTLKQIDSVPEDAAKSLSIPPSDSEKDVDESVDMKSDNNEETIHESDIVEVSPGEECKIISDSLENADITKENEEVLSHDLVFNQNLPNFSVESASVISTSETSGEVENIDNTENEDTDKVVPDDFHISDVSQDNKEDTTEDKENNHDRGNPTLEISALATTNEGPRLNVAANSLGEDSTGTIVIDQMASADLKPDMNAAIISDGKLDLAPSLTIPEANLIDRNELSGKEKISSSTTERVDYDKKDEKTDENSLNNFTVDTALDQSVLMTSNESTGQEETGNITENAGLDKTLLETIQDGEMTDGTQKEIINDNVLNKSLKDDSFELDNVMSKDRISGENENTDFAETEDLENSTRHSFSPTNASQHINEEAAEDKTNNQDTDNTTKEQVDSVPEHAAKSLTILPGDSEKDIDESVDEKSDTIEETIHESDVVEVSPGEECKIISDSLKNVDITKENEEVLSHHLVFNQSLPDFYVESASVISTSETSGEVGNKDNTENKDMDKEVLDPVESNDVSQEKNEGQIENEDHNPEITNLTLGLAVPVSTDKASGINVDSGTIEIDQMVSADLKSDMNTVVTSDGKFELAPSLTIPEAYLIDGNELSGKEKISSSTTDLVNNDDKDEKMDENSSNNFTVDTALDQSVLMTNSESTGPEETGNITENAGLDKTLLETIQDVDMTDGTKREIVNDNVLNKSLKDESFELDNVMSANGISGEKENTEFAETEDLEKSTRHSFSPTNASQHINEEAAEDKTDNQNIQITTKEKVDSAPENEAKSLTILQSDSEKDVDESVDVISDNNEETLHESDIVDVSAGEECNIISDSSENTDIRKENEEVLSHDLVFNQNLPIFSVESASVISTNETSGEVENIDNTENKDIDKVVPDDVDIGDVSQENTVDKIEDKENNHDRVNPVLEISALATTNEGPRLNVAPISPGEDITGTMEIDEVASADMKSDTNTTITTEQANNDNKDEKTDENISNSFTDDTALDQSVQMTNSESTGPEETGNITENAGLDKTLLGTIQDADMTDGTKREIVNDNVLNKSLKDESFELDNVMSANGISGEKENTEFAETEDFEKSYASQYINEEAAEDTTYNQNIQITTEEKVDSAPEDEAKSLTILPSDSEKDVDESVDVISDNNEETLHESDIVDVSTGEECNIISDSSENTDIRKENEEMLSHDLVFNQNLPNFSVESASVISTNETSGEVENIDNTENKDIDKVVPDDVDIGDVSQENTVDKIEDKENNHDRVNPVLEISALATTNEEPRLNVAPISPGEDITGTMEIDEVASADMKSDTNTTITTEQANNDNKDEKTDENISNSFTDDTALDQSVQMTSNESTEPEETGNITENAGLDKTSLDTIQDGDIRDGAQKEIVNDNVLNKSLKDESFELDNVMSADGISGEKENSDFAETEDFEKSYASQHINEEADEDKTNNQDIHNTTKEHVEDAAKSLTILPGDSEKDVDESVDVKSGNNEETIHESDIVEVSPGEECNIISDSLENTNITKENEEVLSHDLVFNQTENENHNPVISTNETSGVVENKDIDNVVPEAVDASYVSQDNEENINADKDHNHENINPTVELVASISTDEISGINITPSTSGKDITGTIDTDQMASTDLKSGSNFEIATNEPLELTPSLMIPDTSSIDKKEKERINPSSPVLQNYDKKNEKAEVNQLYPIKNDIPLDRSAPLSSKEITKQEKSKDITENAVIGKTSMEPKQNGYISGKENTDVVENEDLDKTALQFLNSALDRKMETAEAMCQNQDTIPSLEHDAAVSVDEAKTIFVVPNDSENNADESDDTKNWNNIVPTSKSTEHEDSTKDNNEVIPDNIVPNRRPRGPSLESVSVISTDEPFRTEEIIDKSEIKDTNNDALKSVGTEDFSQDKKDTSKDKDTIHDTITNDHKGQITDVPGIISTDECGNISNGIIDNTAMNHSAKERNSYITEDVDVIHDLQTQTVMIYNDDASEKNNDEMSKTNEIKTDKDRVQKPVNPSSEEDFVESTDHATTVNDLPVETEISIQRLRDADEQNVPGDSLNYSIKVDSKDVMLDKEGGAKSKSQGKSVSTNNVNDREEDSDTEEYKDALEYLPEKDREEEFTLAPEQKTVDVIVNLKSKRQKNTKLSPSRDPPGIKKRTKISTKDAAKRDSVKSSNDREEKGRKEMIKPQQSSFKSKPKYRNPNAWK